MVTALIALLFVVGILLGILALQPRPQHAPVFAPNRAEVLARQHVLYQDLRHQRQFRPLGSTPALPVWRPPTDVLATSISTAPTRGSRATSSSTCIATVRPTARPRFPAGTPEGTPPRSR